MQKMAEEVDAKKDKASFIIANYGFILTTAQVCEVGQIIYSLNRHVKF